MSRFAFRSGTIATVVRSLAHVCGGQGGSWGGGSRCSRRPNEYLPPSDSASDIARKKRSNSRLYFFGGGIRVHQQFSRDTGRRVVVLPARTRPDSPAPLLRRPASPAREEIRAEGHAVEFFAISKNTLDPKYWRDDCERAAGKRGELKWRDPDGGSPLIFHFY
jgi:hypothetical protein